jgi:hypothetical protein
VRPVLNISLELDVEPDEESRNRTLQILLWTLVHLNELYLSRHPSTPRLYESGVRYMREPYRYEQWIPIPRVLQQGGSDCEDLSAWRIAELRQKGFDARPAWSHEERTGPNGEPYRMYHIKVFIPGFGIEDPSRLLGMKSRNVRTIPYPSHWRTKQ